MAVKNRPPDRGGKRSRIYKALIQPAYKPRKREIKKAAAAAFFIYTCPVSMGTSRYLCSKSAMGMGLL